MKVKMHKLIQEIVEEGIESGWNRAHKHSEEPYGDAIKYHIQGYIMNGFDEAFEFDQEAE